MSPQDPQTAALLAHVVSQVEQNVQFLVSQNYISHSDASAFLTKLPNTNNNTGVINNLTTRIQNLVTPSRTPAGPQVVQARALWGYNESGQDADDLSFRTGDIIEIIEETNADWWMGKINGKQALFPSSYVEKIDTTAPAAAAPALPGRGVGGAAKSSYRPFGAAYHGATSAAPAPQPVPVVVPPPRGQGTNAIGLQEDAGQDAKKSKYGKFGNTMAHSAAGGVGFGAGAAIGGGLVRAIF